MPTYIFWIFMSRMRVKSTDLSIITIYTLCRYISDATIYILGLYVYDASEIARPKYYHHIYNLLLYIRCQHIYFGYLCLECE